MTIRFSIANRMGRDATQSLIVKRDELGDGYPTMDFPKFGGHEVNSVDSDHKFCGYLARVLR